jgi:hypothetical protein
MILFQFRFDDSFEINRCFKKYYLHKCTKCFSYIAKYIVIKKIHRFHALSF